MRKKNLNKVISILMYKSQLLKSYIFSKCSNLEWPHRQSGCLVCFRLQGQLPHSCTDLCCARWAQGVLPMRVGVYGHSIRSTIFDSIVRSWLWSTVTWSYPLGYFSCITASSWHLTPNSGSRLSSEGLLAKWDYIFFTVTMFTKFLFWWRFCQIWTFWVLM